VVVDHLEIRAVESQVVNKMEKWDHEKLLEDSDEQNILVSH
jgi:hypothetical protein